MSNKIKNVNNFNSSQLFNVSNVQYNSQSIINNSNVNGKSRNNLSDIETIDVSSKYNVNELKKYSTTGYSDSDNIYMNQFQRIMVDLQNKLSADEYMIYCKYFEGKKVSELIDEDGNLKILDNNDRVKSIINEFGIDLNVSDVINKINKNIRPDDVNKWLSFKTSDGKLAISQEVLNCKIYEIARSDSGYDYTILIDENGNPILINSSTNPNDLEDIAAIAYALSKQLIGEGADELADELFGILSNIEGVEIDNKVIKDFYESLNNKDINNFEALESYYLNQIDDSQKAIEKCIEIAKQNGSKAILNGYSLGGGLLLSSYSKLCIDNPELEEYILGVSAFNPFISVAEQYNEKYDLIDYVAKSDKVIIYSGEEDFVSIFNNSVEKLLERFVFLKTEEIDEEVSNITDFLGFIIGGKSNHGFAPIVADIFDENGNIIQEGKFHAISRTVANVDGNPSFSDFFAEPIDGYINSYSNLIEQVSSSFLKKVIDIPEFNIKEMLSFNFSHKPNYSSIFSNLFQVADVKVPDGAKGELVDSLLDYVKYNVGEYKYDELVGILADGMWGIIKETADSKKWYEKYAVSWFGDEELFKETMIDFFMEEDNKVFLLSMITQLIKQDKTAYNDVLDCLINKIDELYENKIIDKYDNAVPIYAEISVSINREIKKSFLKELKKTLKL